MVLQLLWPTGVHDVTWLTVLGNAGGDYSQPCHGKTCLKIFVVVIPKEGLAGDAPPIPLLVWHWLQNTMVRIQYVKAAEYNFIVGVIPKKDWWGGIRQSFFGYNNDEDLKVCFPVTGLSQSTLIPWGVQNTLTVKCQSKSFGKTNRPFFSRLV